MKKPKIILFDLETSHNIVRAFSLYGYNQPANIIKERYILTASWKELGKNKVHSVATVNKGKHDDDFNVVQKLRKVLSNCDAVVGHYSDKFDMRFLNARIIYHGLDPLPPIIQIDTYKIAKSKFNFNANRLDYLGQYLGVGRKNVVNRELWDRCEAGDRDAFQEMLMYNRQDVELLERIYLKLRPFVSAKLNRALFESRPVCEQCGSDHLHRHGESLTRVGRYTRYQCQSCGHWFRDKKRKKV